VVTGGRKDAIVSSAAQLFSRHGYPATGIDEIGEAAGITGPGVYRHFDNKNGVLNEVVRRAVEKVVAGVADVVQPGKGDWEVLEGLVANMITSVLDDRAGWAVVVREQRHPTRTRSGPSVGPTASTSRSGSTPWPAPGPTSPTPRCA
jgi:AcrR family transcriptional regulator